MRQIYFKNMPWRHEKIKKVMRHQDPREKLREVRLKLRDIFPQWTITDFKKNIRS